MKQTATQRLERRIRDSRDALDALLAPVSPRSHVSVIADLLRRCDATSEIDGYASGNAPERVGGGGTGDPTSSSAAAREADVCGRCVEGKFTLEDGRQVVCRSCGGSGRRWADPIADGVAEILARIGHVHRQTRNLDRKRRDLLSQSRVTERPLSISICLACDGSISGVGEDRSRRGLCPKCHRKFRTWTSVNPDRFGDPGAHVQKFITWRKGELLAEAEAEKLRVQMDDISRAQEAGNLPVKS